MKLLPQKISELINKLASVRDSVAVEQKAFTISDAWALFQTAIAEIVKIIEELASAANGADKKALALQYLEQFYDNVIVQIDIPYVPNIVEPMVDKLIKKVFMALADGAIDATVTLLNKLGIFTKE